MDCVLDAWDWLRSGDVVRCGGVWFSHEYGAVVTCEVVVSDCYEWCFCECPSDHSECVESLRGAVGFGSEDFAGFV